MTELQIFADNLKIITPNLAAVELNVSCPNFAKIDVGDASLVVDMCCFWKEISQLPLILKIGRKSNYIKIAKKTEKIIQAIDINSVPEDEGGISGERAQFVNWRIVKNLIEYTSTPVIAPSVWHYSDIEHLFKMGAGAVSFGSISMINPRRPWGPFLPTMYAKRYLRGG